MKLHIAPKFPSGTNAVINYLPELLPPDLDNAWWPSKESNKYIIVKGHDTEVKKEACKKINRPLKPFPFKASIYVLGTEDNHSTQNNRRSWKRAFMDRVFRIDLTENIKNEFSINWI